MSNTLNILVIGRHKQIMQTVLRLVNGQEGWSATGALTDSEAKIRFSEKQIRPGIDRRRSGRKIGRPFKTGIRKGKSSDKNNPSLWWWQWIIV